MAGEVLADESELRKDRVEMDEVDGLHEVYFPGASSEVPLNRVLAARFVFVCPMPDP